MGPDAGPLPASKDGGSEARLDGGGLDAGLGGLDAGRLDGGADGGAGDGGEAAPGFGQITGDCAVLATELGSPDPSFFENRLDFGADPFDEPADVPALTPGGQDILQAGNAGGSSLYSEVFAYEVLARCEGAALLKTETRIDYVDAGSITDVLVEIDDEKVGVSVTRAVAFPFDDPYSVAQAEELLADKLADVLESSAHVSPGDAWVKQVLHVLAYAEGHAESVRTAWVGLEEALKADTVVFVTVSDGDDAFLY